MFKILILIFPPCLLNLYFPFFISDIMWVISTDLSSSFITLSSAEFSVFQWLYFFVFVIPFLALFQTSFVFYNVLILWMLFIILNLCITFYYVNFKVPFKLRCYSGCESYHFSCLLILSFHMCFVIFIIWSVNSP